MLPRITLLIGLTSALYGATVMDRLAVVVNRNVIKASDIDRDLRVTEFLNGEAADFSSAARRKAAERLIEQILLRQEISSGGFRRASAEEAAALLNRIRQDRFGGSEARMRAELAKFRLTEDDLREQLQWQLTVLRFIDQRFRSGVLVTDEEVRAYYDQHKADLERQYPRDNRFETLAPKIRASLEGERVNQNFAESIEQARKRSRIRFLQEAFQ
jgi:parvulin-like peptidyl-prolyl isomerase